MDIEKPTLILHKERVLKNIERMATKAKRSRVRLRPHFKTHQSAQIGAWFKDYVKTITVSSVEMAIYFANHGWNDITIAFPVNLREISKINELAKKITLHLLVESKESILFLKNNLKAHVNIWIKIDVGSHRTGILWNNFTPILELAQEVKASEFFSFKGILTHAGHSYLGTSKEEITSIYLDSVSKMKNVQTKLKENGFSDVEISVGDTPTCSIVEDLSAVNEIRPGNFVFYDIMQLHLGSCSEKDIAIAIACPVVAKHKDRLEIVIYGGAIHLSKDFLTLDDGTKIFGYISLLEETDWSSPIKNTYVSSLSQEHGIVKTDEEFFKKVKIGDLLVILPIHSCLPPNLLKKYLTFENKIITSM
ncbi:MAG: alanine racemase [Promethearchaeota archaeon]